MSFTQIVFRHKGHSWCQPRVKLTVVTLGPIVPQPHLSPYMCFSLPLSALECPLVNPPSTSNTCDVIMGPLKCTQNSITTALIKNTCFSGHLYWTNPYSRKMILKKAEMLSSSKFCLFFILFHIFPPLTASLIFFCHILQIPPDAFFSLCAAV